ncbi:MAG: hypothetical protein NVSMB64_27770 [Candidatus Velthaea sp.]
MLGRMWFYTNYHCNLACRYCLTESSPAAARRELSFDAIVGAADEALAAGFTAFGVTGGEPFMRPDMADIAVALGSRLPTVILTNGTLFTPRLLDAMAPLANYPVSLQISLDAADAENNDRGRADGNFDRTIAALPALRERGFHLRIGSTVDDAKSAGLKRLCELHRSFGISDDDHVVRPVIRRGRAAASGLGADVAFEDLPPELTLTAEGAFWSPAAPTVSGGKLDVDYLLTRTIRPLTIPLGAMQRVAQMQPRADRLRAVV